MTFGEKLQLLRKEKGWTQEQLAAQIPITRQALSKWEIGAAMPDTENVVRLSELFGVSTDYLLFDSLARNQSSSTAPIAGPTAQVQTCDKIRVVAGVCLSAVSLLGMLILGILSSVFPAIYAVSSIHDPWTRVYTGLWGFLKSNRLEWLFLLCLLSLFIGLCAIWYPKLKGRLKWVKQKFSHGG